MTSTDNVLYFIVNRPADTVDDGQLSVIRGFETYEAYGGAFNDIASFDRGADMFDGHDGNDTAFGALGYDTLYGGIGADSLNGGNGADLLFGGNQNDTLHGGHGNDTLDGGRGSDVIDGGTGRDRILLFLGDDTVTGGEGNDSFVFNRTQTGVHTITDFTSGADRLMFNDVLLQFGPATGGLDPTRFTIGAAVGSQAQFVLTYDAGADISTLLWDPNGDNPAGGTYAVARFDGQVDIAASDILII
ncbi:MAG: hypothetical protein ABI832_18085 [bacterium]